MNTKKDRVAFVESVFSYLGRYLTTETVSCYTFVVGDCTIYLEKEQGHKNVYSICAMFKECNELTSLYNSKYNWHSFNPFGFDHYLDAIIEKGYTNE